MTIRGIAFPFRKENGEFPKMVEDEEAVGNNVIALFNLPVRRRVMRPNVGTNLQSMVFEPTGPVFISMMERSVRRTLAEGEPRAKVLFIDTQLNGTTVTSQVTYEVSGIRKTTVVSRATNV